MSKAKQPNLLFLRQALAGQCFRCDELEQGCLMMKGSVIAQDASESTSITYMIVAAPKDKPYKIGLIKSVTDDYRVEYCAVNIVQFNPHSRFVKVKKKSNQRYNY